MSEKTVELMSISSRILDDFRQIYQLINPEHDDKTCREHASFLMTSYLADLTAKWEEEFPYKTLPAEGGGWNIFYCGEKGEPRLSDVHPAPFAANRKYNADRLRRSLNIKWHKARKLKASQKEEAPI